MEAQLPAAPPGSDSVPAQPGERLALCGAGSGPEAPPSMGRISACSPFLGLGKGVHSTAALRAAEHSSPVAFNSSVPALPHCSAWITPSKLNNALELHKDPTRGEEALDVSPQQAFRVC